MSCDKCGLRDREDIELHLSNLRKNFDACEDIVILDMLHKRIQEIEWILEID